MTTGRRRRDRTDRHPAPASDREQPVVSRDPTSSCSSSPTPTAAASWSSPTGPGCPASADVTAEEWASAQWQRAHCVKNVKQLRALMGDLVEDRFYADLERDQAERATMSMLVPPQMMNTMVPTGPADGQTLDRGVLRRPGAQLHAAGVLRPAHRLAQRTRTRPATRCTSTTCGWPRG